MKNNVKELDKFTYTKYSFVKVINKIFNFQLEK